MLPKKKLSLIFLVFWALSNLAQAMQPSAKKPPHRLALYCDTFKAEDPSTDKTAFAKMLAQNIHDKASFILVSHSIFNTFLKSFIKAQIPTQATSPEPSNNFMRSISFNPTDWKIFHINNSSYFLFIPAQYSMNETFNGTEFSIFNQNNLTDINNGQTPDDISNYLRLQNNTEPTELSKTLPLVFNSLESIETTLLSASPPKLPSFQDKQSTIEYLLSELQPWNILLGGHGNTQSAIAGLAHSDFNAALNFFNTALNTQCILVNSCFIAGNNQLYMSHQKTLTDDIFQKDLRYKIAIAGSSQATTIGVTSTPDNPDNSTNIKNFFSSLEKSGSDFFDNALKYCTAPNDWYSFHLGINSIPQVLIPRVGWSEVFTALPHVNIVTEPRLLKALNDSGTYLIDNSLAAIIKPKTIQTPLSIKPCTTMQPRWLKQEWQKVQVEKNEIPTVFDESNGQNAHYYPTFITPSSGDHLHTINTINVLNQDETPGKVLKFLRDSFLNIQGRTQPTCWVIQELNGFNDLGPYIKELVDDCSFLTKKNCNLNKSLIAALADESSLTLNHVIICSYAQKVINDREDLFAHILFNYKSTWYSMNCTIKKSQGTLHYNSAWNFTVLGEAELTAALTTIEKLIQTKEKLNKIIATPSTTPTQKSLKIILKKLPSTTVTITPPPTEPANNESPEIKALILLKNKLVTLQLALKKLKNQLAVLSIEINALATGTLTPSEQQELLATQEQHKAASVGIINSWKNKPTLTEADLNPFTQELSHLSKKQARYLAPLIQKTLSNEQQLSLAESLYKKITAQFISLQPLNVLTEYAHIFKTVSGGTTISDTVGTNALYKNASMYLQFYNDVYESSTDYHRSIERAHQAEEEASRTLCNVLFTHYYQTQLPLAVNNTSAETLHTALLNASANKAETILEAFVNTCTEEHKIALYQALAGTLDITKNNSHTAYFNLYAFATKLFFSIKNNTAYFNDLANKLYAEWKHNFPTSGASYQVDQSQLLFAETLAGFFLYCDYNQPQPLDFVRQLITKNIFPSRLNRKILLDIIKRYNDGPSSPANRFTTLMNTLSTEYHQLLPKSNSNTSSTLNNQTTFVYSDIDAELTINQLAELYLAFIPHADTPQLAAIKDWLINSFFVNALPSKDIRSQTLLSIVGNVPPDTAAANNFTILYNAFKNSGSNALKKLILSYSTWGDDTSIDFKIKEIARAIEG